MAPKKKNTAKKGAGKKSANLRYSVPTKETKGGIYNNRAATLKRYEQVCALSNPFCAAARGSKIPDDDSSPSIAASFASTFELNTDANGDAAFQVQSSLNHVFKKATTVVGTNVTVWGPDTNMKDYTAIGAAFDNYRIVSMGVRVYTTLAPTDQSGYCRIVTAPTEFPNNVNIDGSLWEAVQTYPVSELDAHVVMKPQGTQWKQYVSIGADQNYNQVAGIIKGSKANALGSFIVEIVMHCELLVEIGSVTGSLATPAANHDTHALTAAGATHARHKGIHNGPTRSVMATLGNFAKDALLDVAGSAIPFVGNALAGLFRPRASHAMIVD